MENNQQNSDKLKNCLGIYGFGLDYLKVHNDNYFKRTQILMVAIQSVLFVSFIHYLSRYETESWTRYSWVLLAGISLLGGLSAFTWSQFHLKQQDYLEFCKRYLRNIEHHLIADFNVPLDYFVKEAKVFHKLPEIITFQWSKEKFPDSESIWEGLLKLRFFKKRGGLVDIDRYMALAMIIVWVSALVFCVFKYLHSNC